MGKRSDFPRINDDDYATPRAAVEPLLRHLAPGTKFIDPACGAGELARHLVEAGHICAGAFNQPARDAMSARYDDIDPAAIFVTNLPWGRGVLHPAIINLSDQRPLWTLFDTGWIFTQRAAPYLPRLRHIVAVKRYKWIPNSPLQAMDDCCWLLFGTPRPEPAQFFGRVDAPRGRKAA